MFRNGMERWVWRLPQKMMWLPSDLRQPVPYPTGISAPSWVPQRKTLALAYRRQWHEGANDGYDPSIPRLLVSSKNGIGYGQCWQNFQASTEQVGRRLGYLPVAEPKERACTLEERLPSVWKIRLLGFPACVSTWRDWREERQQLLAGTEPRRDVHQERT